MTFIVGIAGKKQSGKNTAANWLLGVTMRELQLVQKGYDLNDEGRLRITDLFGDDSFSGVFNYFTENPDAIDFLDEHIHPWYKIYSFADVLKRDICMFLLGVKYESVYGTDEQKNAPTHLKWEDMPGVSTPENFEVWAKFKCTYEQDEDDFKSLTGNVVKTGYMSGREVLQYVGTEIFRRMNPTVWADATISRIQAEGPELAVIADCRFPDEVEAIQAAGGKVIRLTRTTYEDSHESETALDKEDFDWKKFDAVIDNQDKTIPEMILGVAWHLVDWGYLSKEVAEKYLL